MVLVVLALIVPPASQARMARDMAMQTAMAVAPARQAMPSQAHLRRAPFEGPYQAELVNVVDGDTFEARIRIWFGQEITTLVRIRGIDAPELKARCAAEAARALAAKEALADFLVLGQIILSDVAMDKYGGRVLANVAIEASDPAGGATNTSHDSIASLMLNANLARPYFGDRRMGWCEEAPSSGKIRPERQASQNALPADNRR